MSHFLRYATYVRDEWKSQADAEEARVNRCLLLLDTHRKELQRCRYGLEESNLKLEAIEGLIKDIIRERGEELVAGLRAR